MSTSEQVLVMCGLPLGEGVEEGEEGVEGLEEEVVEAEVEEVV